jgi:hypothetical protein
MLWRVDHSTCVRWVNWIKESAHYPVNAAQGAQINKVGFLGKFDE